MPDNLDIPDFGDVPVFDKIEIQNSDWRDGIVVRTPNWLGDAVMGIPALMQLSRIVPENCGFFLVVPPGLQDLFNSLEFVDKVIPLHKAHSPYNSEDMKSLKRLRAGIGHFQNNSLRDAFYFKLAGIPKLYGAAKRCRSLFLKKSFKFPKIKNKELNYLHHAGRYLSMAYALGASEWKGELPKFKQAKEPEIMTNEVRNVIEMEKLLVIAPGAAYGEAKRWPADNFKSVCEKWIGSGGNVAIIGTSGEIDVAQDVAKGLDVSKITNLAGKTDMPDLIEILKNAEQCVANDSGVMHLSAILGGSGAAIFGSTDPSSTSPVSTKWKILFERQECAPCFKRECPFGHYKCLKAITPEMVCNLILDT